MSTIYPLHYKVINKWYLCSNKKYSIVLGNYQVFNSIVKLIETIDKKIFVNKKLNFSKENCIRLVNWYLYIALIDVFSGEWSIHLFFIQFWASWFFSPLSFSDIVLTLLLWLWTICDVSNSTLQNKYFWNFCSNFTAFVF